MTGPAGSATQPATRSRSSRGLGHCPFTAATGVRIPYGTPSDFNGLDAIWASQSGAIRQIYGKPGAAKDNPSTIGGYLPAGFTFKSGRGFSDAGRGDGAVRSNFGAVITHNIPCRVCTMDFVKSHMIVAIPSLSAHITPPGLHRLRMISISSVSTSPSYRSLDGTRETPHTASCARPFVGARKSTVRLIAANIVAPMRFVGREFSVVRSGRRDRQSGYFLGTGASSRT